MPKRGEFEDLTGREFGRLTVIGLDSTKTVKSKKRIRRYQIWKCVCVCGNTCLVKSIDLKSGHTRSCGCYMVESRRAGHRKTHGLSRTRLYRIFASMKTRCYNSADSHYQSYGGRGITICDEWLSDFSAFYKWAMENGYKSDGTCSIDRIDVDKGYSPDNCRLIPMHEQGFNKTNTHYIEVQGERLSIAKAAEIYGLNVKTIYTRVYRGQTPIREEELCRRLH